MKYKIHNRDYIIREDKNDVSMLYNKSTGEKLYLNKYALDVYKRVLIEQEFDDILNDSKIKYPDISSEELKTDLIELFNLFCIYRIIEIIDKDTFKNDIKFIGNEDYKVVSNFIITNFEKSKFVLNKNVNLQIYSPELIRLRNISGEEYFYVNYKNNSVKCVITVYISRNFANVINIMNIFIKDEDVNSNFLKETIDFIRYNTILTNPKVRIMINNSTYDNLKEYFEKLGFKIETILKHELIDSEDLIYLKYI